VPKIEEKIEQKSVSDKEDSTGETVAKSGDDSGEKGNA